MSRRALAIASFNQPYDHRCFRANATILSRVSSSSRPLRGSVCRRSFLLSVFVRLQEEFSAMRINVAWNKAPVKVFRVILWARAKLVVPLPSIPDDRVVRLTALHLVITRLTELTCHRYSMIWSEEVTNWHRCLSYKHIKADSTARMAQIFTQTSPLWPLGLLLRSISNPLWHDPTHKHSVLLLAIPDHGTIYMHPTPAGAIFTRFENLTLVRHRFPHP